MPRDRLAYRALKRPVGALTAIFRNRAAWARALSRPGEVHVGDRLRMTWTPWEAVGQPNGARSGLCAKCQEPFVASRSYRARVYVMLGADPRGTHRETRWVRALRCTACKDETRRQRPPSRRRAERRAATRAALRCGACGAPLDARRSTRRFCSLRCRVRGWRQRNGNGFAVR